MPVVAIPMMIRLTISVFLRPTRSPTCPKTTPPIGRAAKPRA